MKVFVYAQKIKAEDADIVKLFFEELEKHDVEIGVNHDLYDLLAPNGIDTKPSFIVSHGDDLIKDQINIAFSLGGDGTLLAITTYIKGQNIPIFGINLGRLGFLATIEKRRIITAVREVMKGKFHTEERSLLKLESNLPIFGNTPYALNDFTIHKRDTASMVTIHAYVDDVYLNTYWADGIIVATPTGSTGYSMSCGGPIIFPDSKSHVITPVAPHSLNVRPIILSDAKKVSFEIEGRADNYLCTLDSRNEIISSEHKLTISKAEYAIHLGMLEDMNFMITMREKLLWGLDRRN
jgi:NAD+ kinase